MKWDQTKESKKQKRTRIVRMFPTRSGGEGEGNTGKATSGQGKNWASTP